MTDKQFAELLAVLCAIKTELKVLADRVRAQLSFDSAYVGSYTVTAAGTPIVLAQNALRSSAVIVNNSGNDISLCFAAVPVLGNGITIPNGWGIVFGKNTDIPYTGPVTAISVLPSVISVTEINEALIA